MKKNIIISIIIILFLSLIPYTATIDLGKQLANPSKYSIKITNKDGQTYMENMEEYICNSIIAVSDKKYNDELLMTMSICEYTFLAYCREIYSKPDYKSDLYEDGMHCHLLIETDNAKNKFGNEYYEKVRKCVKKTFGKIITYDKKPANPVYFLSSDNVVEQNSYIIHIDKTNDNKYCFHTDYIAGILKFMLQYSTLFDDSIFSDNSDEWISNIIYNEHGEVISAEIGGIKCDAKTICSALGLSSENFTFSSENNIFTFTTFGYDNLAGINIEEANDNTNNMDYKKMISYYFPGSAIEIYEWKNIEDKK